MKKIFLVLLALVLVIGLTACGSDENVHGSVEEAETKARTSETAETSAPETEEEFEIGTSNGSVYKNEFLGIKGEFGSEWHLYSEEECKKMNEQVMGVLGDDYAEQLENADYFYDMVAAIEEKGYSVNVVLENKGLTASITDLVESLKQGCEESKTAYENMGYTDVNYEITKLQFLGNEYDGMQMTAKINGIDCFIKQIVYMKGKYAVSLTVFTLGADECDNIFGFFSKI